MIRVTYDSLTERSLLNGIILIADTRLVSRWQAQGPLEREEYDESRQFPDRLTIYLTPYRFVQDGHRPREVELRLTSLHKSLSNCAQFPLQVRFASVASYEVPFFSYTLTLCFTDT